MKLTLKIWRQKNASDKGGFATYPVDHVSKDMSFLEMLDVLNDQLTEKGEDPVHFDHDCREGICGMCSYISMESLTDRFRRLLVSCTCVRSMMERLLP